MYWNFILNDGATQLQLDTPPLGWDSGTANITRDGEKHGVAFDYSIGNVRYYGDGYSFIKSAYEALGTEAKVNLTIQYKCAADAVFEDFYTGKLDFGSYIEYVGSNGCYVSINVESTDTVMTFNNRFDQKVNLDSTVSFDGVSLPNYDNLGTIINLKAKAIPVSDSAKVSSDTEAGGAFISGLQDPFNSSAPIGTPTNLTYIHLSVGFNNTAASEIGNFYAAPPEENQVRNAGNTGTIGDTFSIDLPDSSSTLPIGVWPLGISPVINYTEGSPSYGELNGTCRLRVNIEGVLNVRNTYFASRQAFIICKLPFSTRSDFGTREEDYEWLYKQTLNDSTDPTNIYYPPNSAGFVLRVHDYNCDIQFELNEGDRLYMFIAADTRSTQAQINAMENDTSIYAYDVSFKDSTYFLLENKSFGGSNSSSDCRVFLLNETISRITEAITNGNMRAYSDYFGRPNSQPYSTPFVGCGALEAITSGLFIRQMDTVRTATPPELNLSLDDVFKGINPIHNVGFGIEDDPNRAGFKMLRVEPVKYFYPDSIIFTATGVSELTLQCTPNKIYSKFLFGYEKWESQKYTGLDEFLTKREYRTSLTSVSNTLSQVSSFVASGYTIEIVRRLGNKTSEDNSYDKETFIVCLKENPIEQEFYPVSYYRLGTEPLETLTITNPAFCHYVASKGNARIDFLNDGEPCYIVPFVNNFTEGYMICYDFGGPFANSNTSATFTIPSTHQYAPEQGSIDSPSNIIDPTTIYNYRISPNRNAMRWAKSIFQSYRNLPESLIYTDGDGNTFASGQLNSAAGCKLEAGAIAENATITPASFADPSDAAPIFNPETVSFTYPITHADFINIMTNRMGLIGYEINGVTKYGWISNFQFTFETGLATFQLIPKYE